MKVWLITDEYTCMSDSLWDITDNEIDLLACYTLRGCMNWLNSQEFLSWFTMIREIWVPCLSPDIAVRSIQRNKTLSKIWHALNTRRETTKRRHILLHLLGFGKIHSQQPGGLLFHMIHLQWMNNCFLLRLAVDSPNICQASLINSDESFGSLLKWTQNTA